MKKDIDCVIVGYLTTPLQKLLDQARTMQNYSGAFRYLHLSSINMNGKRIDYPDLFNQVVEKATGKPSDFHESRLPNLAALYLASYLKQRHIETEIINFLPYDERRFKEVLATKPNLVAITTTFYYDVAPVKYLVDFVRRESPDSKIVVGGPFISQTCKNNPEKSVDFILKQMGADIYVVEAQGEYALSQICVELRSLKPKWEKVKNLIFTQDNKIFHRTAVEPEANVLDDGAIDYSLFPSEDILPIAPLRAARSCPFKCSFCNFPVLAGVHEVMSLTVLEKQLDYLSSIGVTQLSFIDDTFNVPRKRFQELCRMMIRKNYGFRWICQFRCGNATDEDFDLLAEAGCEGVLLGIESGHPDILRFMNKGATPEKYRKGIAKFREKNIVSFASFIVGFPGETDETFETTKKFIEETAPDYYVLEPYFCDSRAPIMQQSGTFGLKGGGYSWQHNTMDWKKAIDLVERGYHSISRSVIMPPLTAEYFWFYLLGQGFSRKKVDMFFAIASKMLVASLKDNDEKPSHEALMNELVALFKEE